MACENAISAFDQTLNAAEQIGYTIRLESNISSETQLVLMTPGILLKKLAKDPMLVEYTHVLIDEVRVKVRPNGDQGYAVVADAFDSDPMEMCLTRGLFRSFLPTKVSRLLEHIGMHISLRVIQSRSPFVTAAFFSAPVELSLSYI